MEEFMREAIKEATSGIKAKDGGPFGAVIVRDDKIIAKAHNTVLFSRDPTAHAEINAIRAASKKLGKDMSGCVIYSTTEPCPMCFSAIHWAKIDKVVFGTKIEDVAKLGFNEMPIKDFTLKFLGNLKIEIEGDFLSMECLELLSKYKKIKGETY
ncbi:MAG: nucleoside deaminase [Candidatus Altiarchaeota archaeon]|nr:nucleoside deaminase [Candidatus Altiarchaeota archaeon]